MRYAYYGVYFAYFEQGRSDLLRSIGLPYPVLEQMGFILPVIEAHAEYRRPARYDDLIHITTTLRDKPIARIRLDYEVFDEQRSEVIAEGYTIHSFVNATSGKPTRAPISLLEVIEKALSGKPGKG
jgi:acyl-CoA thioester hydrolase